MSLNDWIMKHFWIAIMLWFLIQRFMHDFSLKVWTCYLYEEDMIDVRADIDFTGDVNGRCARQLFTTGYVWLHASASTSSIYSKLSSSFIFFLYSLFAFGTAVFCMKTTSIVWCTKVRKNTIAKTSEISTSSKFNSLYIFHHVLKCANHGNDKYQIRKSNIQHIHTVHTFAGFKL